MHSLTRVLAGELGPYDITVNAFAPGIIPTEMNRFAEADDDRKEALLDTLSLRRWGDAQDVANLVCFLSSDLARYITGALHRRLRREVRHADAMDGAPVRGVIRLR